MNNSMLQFANPKLRVTRQGIGAQGLDISDALFETTKADFPKKLRGSESSFMRVCIDFPRDVFLHMCSAVKRPDARVQSGTQRRSFCRVSFFVE